MAKFKIMQTDAYKVEIFIGGDYNKAADICEAYCTDVGLCVTVDPTMYVYRGGRCLGVRIGLINYARFPREAWDVWCDAEVLADKLLDGLDQGSYTIQDRTKSVFYTRRPEDGCEP